MPALLLSAVVAACLLCGAEAAASSCTAPLDASGSDLLELNQRSCQKVLYASEELPSLMEGRDQELREMWSKRSQKAIQQCKTANASGLLDGANLALSAWTEMMDGLECCNKLEPPFCVTSDESRATHLAFFAAFLMFALVIMLSPFCFKQLTAPSFFGRSGPPPLAPVAAAAEKRRREAISRALATGTSPTAATSTAPALADARGDQARKLKRKLEEAFMGAPDVERGGQGRDGVRASPLRVLPGAAGWASATADLFVFLWRVFDFQQDSVLNQFEHLLSLWRSHVAMVADRASEGKQLPRSGPASEAELLKTALQEMHAELLEGFALWRNKLRACSEAGAAERKSLPMQLAGETWPKGDPTKVPFAQELAEVAVFLLIWGEAGNIRFMPEVIYFLTELALAATSSPQGRRLPSHAGSLPSTPSGSGGGSTRSPGFLALVIRPIYNVIFDEHHERVGIDVPLVEIKWATSGRDGEFRLLTCRVKDPSSRWGESYTAEVRLEKPHSQRQKERFPASQQWMLDPVGYSADGQRLVRIRWAADRTRCLDVSSWGRDGRQIQLKEADESADGQVFVHDTAADRLAWQETVTSDDGVSVTHRLYRLGAAGSEDAEAMRVQMQEVVGTGMSRGGQALKVEVKQKKSGKDQKQLRQGFESFFPPDAANYDDWNEIFCKPELLAKRLMLSTGDPLFDIPHGQRFGALHQVSWRKSLAGVKTHRELHSYWGVFAATHRVWLLHELAFVNLVCLVSSRGYTGAGDASSAVVGQTASASFAAAGLVIPVHAALWHFACWSTTGTVIRERRSLVLRTALAFGNIILWSVPILTYLLVRICEARGGKLGHVGVAPLLVLHFAAVAVGAALLLLAPARGEDQYWKLSRSPCWKRVARWVFWILVFGAKVAFGVFLVNVINNANKNLLLPGLLRTSIEDVRAFAFTSQWDRQEIEWLALWATGFLLFLTDTQLWFTIGCTIAGAGVGLAQRQWGPCRTPFEDAIAKIPERFCQKVLSYDHAPGSRARETGPFSPHFPMLWDRIIEYMRYDDKVDDTTAGELTFQPRSGGATLASLSERLPDQPRGSTITPSLFTFGHRTGCLERYLRRDLNFLPDDSWPRNAEMQWRLSALGRGLGLNLPRPFRAPDIPGITVLIPHYGETIIMGKNELWVDRSLPSSSGGAAARGPVSTVRPEDRNVQLISWLEHRYSSEFSAFLSRMGQRSGDWRGIGRKWNSYNEEQWLKLCVWASMRNQTLLRTVAGMTLYHQALDCHHTVQGNRECLLGRDEVWDPAACFTCLIAMQQYAYFNATQLEHTEWMFKMFPSSLKVAFIDSEDKGAQGDTDNVHAGQQRRYFSCLIDRHCKHDPSSNRRKPRFRIELPGFPILGDGKGDNQNTAIPFSRGQFIQCIDANQGGYFEQMLLLPCALGEFRSSGTGASGRAGAKKIVGFPEHITSDIGSIGDFAASAEFAFGTVLQRAHSALGGRMHYGHPDVMNKAYMMQQGGVSKATKTVNLSEDIFAGMDFTLRGGGRSIVHREYLHLTKGRDMGFATVLQFFSKLSAGAGEVVLTRQSLRLGQLMPLPEFLTFYYAHVGFYFTQFFMSRCPPTLMFLWLLVVVSSKEANFDAMDERTGMQNPPPSDSEAIALVFSQCFSWVVLLFLIAQAMPYVVAVWSQQGILMAIPRYFKQLITLSPLHFIFQAKVIGIYVTNELRIGGAQYIATGRGLPIDRRPFISERGGLYQDFVQIALYDGARLLGCAVLVVVMGGAQANLTWWWACLALTIFSWLYAPFIFNPYQFAHRFFHGDVRGIKDFFQKDGGSGWVAWYERTQLKKGTGLRVTIFDLVYWFLFIAAWYTTVASKLRIYTTLFQPSKMSWLFPCLPPVFLSLFAAAVAACLEPACGHQRSSQPGAAKLLHLLPIAGIVVVLDLMEVAIGLYPLASVHWWKACGASLILKYSCLSLLLNVVEQTLRLDWCRCSGYFRALLRLWLYGHRMAMDLLVSSLIFWTLAPVVLFDRMRDLFCANCSFHHLLVFRDPGQLARDEAPVLGEVGMRTPLASDRGDGALDPPLPPAPEQSTMSTGFGAGLDAAGPVPPDSVMSIAPPSRAPAAMPPQKGPAAVSGPPPARMVKAPSAAAPKAAPKTAPKAAPKLSSRPAAPSTTAASSTQAAAARGSASAAASPTPDDLDAFEDDFVKAEDVVRLARAAAAPKSSQGKKR